MQLLKTASLIPLKTFFTVDTTSSYYNESAKANVFYVQAWAFVHYLMHGEYASRFKSYIDALATGDAMLKKLGLPVSPGLGLGLHLLEYLGVSERDLEFGFQHVREGLFAARQPNRCESLR
jgi:hypothetical protein